MNILDELAALRAHDLPMGEGRTLAYVYDAGLPDLDAVAAEAVGAFAGTNGLDPTAFPSLLAMENDLVGFALDLVHGPDTAVGTVTSGGTESCLLAVQAARDAAGIERPNLVVPDTVHAAFHKAAHYFGVEIRAVPTGADFRAVPDSMADAMDGRTVLVVGSAASYAHGVIDPIPELAALAAERGVRMHVDACIGGWILAYAARVGRDVPDWDFAVDGVTSVSVDTHKYAYAPKGTSLLLHRTPALRRSQYFAHAGWPGYTMLNSTLQGTKSGGPLAGAWTVMRTLGHAGYEDLTLQAFAAVDQILDGLPAALSPLAPPDATLIALGTDGSCDPFTICDEMKARGWYVQPQMSFAHSPANLHLSVAAATNAHVSEFVEALADSVRAAQAAGPVEVDQGVVDFIRALDPANLTDDDFDGLLAASGLIGGGEGLALPDAMAPINAMLDLASPAMREALLKAFLDRLARPTRSGPV